VAIDGVTFLIISLMVQKLSGGKTDSMNIS